MFGNIPNAQFHGGNYTTVGRDFYQTNQTNNYYHSQKRPTNNVSESLKHQGRPRSIWRTFTLNKCHFDQPWLNSSSI